MCVRNTSRVLSYKVTEYSNLIILSHSTYLIITSLDYNNTDSRVKLRAFL